MKETIERALQTKNRARTAREAGDLDRALFHIEAASRELDALWDERGAEIDRVGRSARPEDRDLVDALAETHGIRGGIYRSLGRYQDAVEAYDRGLTFEEHAARKADSSYNLVQRLVNRVLLPERAGTSQRNVPGVDLGLEIQDAAGKLREQIATSRARDPWAAADLVVVQLLSALLSPETGRSRIEEAWADLEALRPRAFVYESTLRVLRDLQERLETVPYDDRPPSRKAGGELLHSLVQRFVGALDDSRA